MNGIMGGGQACGPNPGPAWDHRLRMPQATGPKPYPPGYVAGKPGDYELRQNAMPGEPGGSKHAGRPRARQESPSAQTTILPAGDRSASVARQATREALSSWRLTSVADTAELLVSELVTNAVLHAGRSAAKPTLRLTVAAGCLRIEVHDSDSRWPQQRTPGSLDESGFGLVLVDCLADKWGVLAIPEGKAVWAELAARQAPDPLS
jgi:anti-sigma regulatory factor (Ser/Thr protein kinase)